MTLKYIYDANLFVCPFCKDSWYIEEDEHYRIGCKCGINTAVHLSKKRAEMEWNKILYRYFSKRGLEIS